MNGMTNIDFRTYLIASMIVAFAAFCSDALSSSYLFGDFIYLSLGMWIGAAWIIIAIGAAFVFRTRAVWILLGAPFALGIPLYLAITFTPCNLAGTGCL